MTPILDPAALFQSVSDATRLRLLRLLVREELNVQELVRITGLSQPRVSKHLSILREQGWLEQRREGTWSWYRAVDRGAFAAGAELFDQVAAAADRVAGAAADDGTLAVVLSDRQARARDFFSGIADRWDGIREAYEHPDLRLGALGALVDPGLRLLDIGTGTGAMLPVFGQAVRLVVALDNSPAMLARAQARCRHEDLDSVRFVNADVADLPFAEGAFDAVSCAMVLHHVARPAVAVAEMARVLRPGGRLLVTAFDRHEQTWMRRELAHHWLGFTRAEMDGYFADAGLRPGRRLLRGPRPESAGSVPGRGPGQQALDWPDVFLAVAVKTSDAIR